MKTLSDFPVNLTASQRKAVNRTSTMRNFRTGLACGDELVGVWVTRFEAMSCDKIVVNTSKNVFTWVVTPRGRVMDERTAKVGN